jgi:cytochrome c biogenesis factor
MNLKKYPSLVYLLCFLVVIAPGLFILFTPKLKSKSEGHASDQRFLMILIGSIPFVVFCIIKSVDYFFALKAK